MEMEFNDRRKDDEAGKSSATKRQLDDYQSVEIVGDPRNRVVDSPVKRRLRNIDIRRKVIDQFEEELRPNFPGDRRFSMIVGQNTDFIRFLKCS